MKFTATELSRNPNKVFRAAYDAKGEPVKIVHGQYSEGFEIRLTRERRMAMGKVDRFPDGSLCLECGDSGEMEADLVFAMGGMIDDDPTYIKQLEILERIQLCVNACSNFTSDELKDCLPGGNSEIGIKIGVRDE